MALVVGAVVVGLLAGRALPPLRHRHLAPNRVRWLPVLAAGFALAVLAERLDDGAAVAVAIAGQALLVAGVIRNVHIAGAGLLAVGLGCNLASMVVDNGVPVRASAMVDAHVLDAAELDGAVLAGPRHVEDGGDRMTVLADVIPVAPARTVVSVGDVLTVVAIGAIAAHAVRRRRPAVDTIVIDLRGHVRSDEELEAMLRHPTSPARPEPALQ